jgi:tetratricopeptide (TPR) repeat protein
MKGENMFKFKCLFRFLAVCFGIIAILSISSASTFASEKLAPAGSKQGPEIFVQLAHQRVISTLAISPDGKYLASADTNVGGKNIKIWDMLSGREFRTIILGGFEEINYLKFSVDAKQIFAVTFTKIYVFDVYNGNNIKIIDVGHLPNFIDIHWVRKNIDGVFSDYGFSVSKNIALYVSSYDYPDYPKEIKVDNFIYTLFQKEKEGSDYILEVRRMSDRVKVRQIELNSLTFFVTINEDVIFTPDLKHLITAHDDGTISIWDLKTGQKVRELGKVKPTGFMALSYPFSLDNRFLYNLNFADEESQVVWDIKSGRRLYYIQKGETVTEEYSSFVKKNFVATKDGKIKVSSMYSESSDQKFKAIIDWSRDNTIRIYEKTTNKELAQFISFTDGEWIVITPEGYFNASPNAAKHLNVRVDNKVYGIDQFYAKFYRPELVQLALAGKEVPKGELITDIATSVLLLSAVNAQAVSEEAREARRHMARGQAAVEMAKSPEDYEAAIREFQEAARLAPDWPDPYYNLGLVQEKAGKFMEAIASLKEYLRLAPNAPDAAKIQEQIYKLEYKAEQVLTVPEIIDVLVSLSDEEIWQVVGDCKKDNFNMYYSNKLDFRRLDFKREGNDAVRSLKDFQWEPDPTFQILKVTGPVLKYITTRNISGGSKDSPKDPSITAVMEHEVTVVSKRLVKVNQKVLRAGIGNGVDDGQSFSCTFQKK